VAVVHVSTRSNLCGS